MVKWEKVAIAAGVAAALVGAGFVGAAVKQPDVQIEEVEVIKEVPLIEYVEVAGETVTVTETVIEQVEDVALLEQVCDKLMFDDIQECREEVSAEGDALKLALELLEDEDEVFDLLEDEGIIKDEDDANIVRVYDDFEDVVIKKSDFDDGEYKFEVKVKVEDEDRDQKKYVWFKLGVEDGEAEILKVWE